MKYGNVPVRIPDVPGKIIFRKVAKSTYVLYEVGRVYSAERKNTTPKRVNIGQQIRTAPGMMLPNENYVKHFPEEAAKMTAEEAEIAELYGSVRSEYRTLQVLFDQLYYEFLILARKNPGEVVNEYKVERINKVLEPIMDLMEGKPYDVFLEKIAAPGKVTGEDGSEQLTGLTNSDVSLLLTQYKGAITRFGCEVY